jgi:hypothetical protein
VTGRKGVRVKRFLVLVAVIGAISAGTAGVVSADAGAERIPVECVAAYHPEFGGFVNMVPFTSDTPNFAPIDPIVVGSDMPIFGPGTGVFTPSGNMDVTCTGHFVDPRPLPFVQRRGGCIALRGGDDYGHGSRSYAGEVHVVVTPSGNVTITCHGSFTGILP